MTVIGKVDTVGFGNCVHAVRRFIIDSGHPVRVQNDAFLDLVAHMIWVGKVSQRFSRSVYLSDIDETLNHIKTMCDGTNCIEGEV